MKFTERAYMSKSLLDPTNFLGLTTTLSVNGSVLAISITKMSEQIPNEEQVALITNALSQPIPSADRYPTLSQATVSHKLEVFSSDSSLLEEWTVTVDPSLPADEVVNLFTDMGAALANFSGQ